MKVVGVIRYPSFNSCGGVSELGMPPHALSYCILLAPASSANHGPPAYAIELTTNSEGVSAVASLPDILEICTLLVSTDFIVSLAM